MIPFLAFAQWNYGKLNNEIGTYAVGDINFMGFDDFEFKLIKSKNKDLALSINSEYFIDNTKSLFFALINLNSKSSNPKKSIFPEA